MSGDAIRLRFPARPEYLLLARLAVTAVARRMALGRVEVGDLKLAVTEACSNAVRHAYAKGPPGEIGLELVTRKVWDSPAVRFDSECIASVRAGVARAGFSTRDIVSGAGHDAAYIARIVPTTMIFVPCAGGLSHNEAESTTFDECAAGAQVLLNAVLEYDRRFAAP